VRMSPRFFLAIGMLLLGSVAEGGINRDLSEYLAQKERDKKSDQIRGVPVVVAIDEKATEAHLIVPKKYLPAVYALLAPEDRPVMAQGPAPARTSLVYGVPLAMVLALAGCAFLGVHNRIGVRRAEVLLALLAIVGTGGAYVWANAPQPEVPATQYKGRVVLEVVDGGDTVKMILPRDMLVPAARIVPQGSP
jgi:hypothetical protein